MVVFDGWKQKGNPGEKTQFHNIQVVYTKENETADAYIEALAGCPVHIVSGNNDFYSELPFEDEFEVTCLGYLISCGCDDVEYNFG